MRQNGRSPAGCNVYIRAMDAFCSYLLEQGVLTDAIKLKQIKTSQKAVQVLSDREIRLFLAGKPSKLTYLRSWVLIALLLDTGCRIDEVLTLTKEKVDFDNLLITVKGKGSKERKVPFSPEMRKHLWTFMKRATRRHVFGTKNNTQMTYRNAYRSVKRCFKACGVTGSHVHPHNLRHTFACHFIKQQGRLSLCLAYLGMHHHQ